MTRIAWFIFAAFALTACGDLDSVDYVHDLRMLAARADPPGQLVDPNAIIASAAQGGSSTTPVTVTALVADPMGGGRAIDYTWSTCAAVDPNSQRCLTSGTGYQVLQTGSAISVDGYAEITTQVQPPDTLLVQALAKDPYHGFDGLFFPIQLTVQAGNEHVTGVKLVTYMPPYPGITYTPPTNPNLQGLTVESQAWAPSGFTFTQSQKPKDGWSIAPVFDANAQAHYQLPTFGGKILDLKEDWQFDFFTTLAKGFTPTTSGGVALVNNVEAPTDSRWNPDDSDATQTGTFCVVVRTGRGGSGWLILPATWTP